MSEQFIKDVRSLERAGRFSIEYEQSRSPDGWSGREPDYAPYTVTVATRNQDGDEAFLPEDEWLRFAGFDVEGAVRSAADAIGRDEHAEHIEYVVRCRGCEAAVERALAMPFPSPDHPDPKYRTPTTPRQMLEQVAVEEAETYYRGPCPMCHGSGTVVTEPLHAPPPAELTCAFCRERHRTSEHRGDSNDPARTTGPDR